MAQEIIKLRAAMNDWVLVTHPKKESIPSELFAALPSQKVAQEVLSFFEIADLDRTKILSFSGISRVTRKQSPKAWSSLGNPISSKNSH